VRSTPQHGGLRYASPLRVTAPLSVAFWRCRDEGRSGKISTACGAYRNPEQNTSGCGRLKRPYVEAGIGRDGCLSLWANKQIYRLQLDLGKHESDNDRKRGQKGQSDHTEIQFGLPAK
jgi:hypothetical protein